MLNKSYPTVTLYSPILKSGLSYQGPVKIVSLSQLILVLLNLSVELSSMMKVSFETF